ncbi:hypothetical protein B4N84_07700 [Flavobacterium sp. IR1]|nr:hypothetical protein B4N84_07700 [Flavobacterium sp. IR1]
MFSIFENVHFIFSIINDDLKNLNIDEIILKVSESQNRVAQDFSQQPIEDIVNRNVSLFDTLSEIFKNNSITPVQDDIPVNSKRRKKRL